MKMILYWILKEWKAVLPITISIVALGFGIFKGCQTDAIFRKQHYIDTGIQYRPNIVLSDTPQILSYRFLFKPVIPVKTIVSDTLDVETTPRISINLKVENMGNAKAKIIGYFITDTVFGGTFLREIIESKTKLSKYCALSPQKDFYQSMEILPFEKKVIPLTVDITAPFDTIITIHFLCLYVNEYNVMFDSYFWIRYNTIELIMKNNGLDESGNPKLMVANKDLYSFFKYFDSNYSSFLYSYDEKLEIENNLKPFYSK